MSAAPTPPSNAAEVVVLHAEAVVDYAEAEALRQLQDHRDDANLHGSS